MASYLMNDGAFELPIRFADRAADDAHLDHVPGSPRSRDQ